MSERKFDFNHCPECGGSVRRPSGGWFAVGGLLRTCEDCGKEWHVIWENEEDWVDPDESEE